jgi:hypothetical protein
MKLENPELNKQHELLKSAMQATDNYLFIEKKAKELGKATPHMIHDFTYHMSAAHDALEALGVLNQHEDYMKVHVEAIRKLAIHDDPVLADLPYAHVPASDVGEVEEAVKMTPSAQDRFKQGLKKAGYDPDAGAKRLLDVIAKNKKAREDFEAKQKKEHEAHLERMAKLNTEEKEEDEDENVTEDDMDQMVNDLKWEDIVDYYDDDELVDGEEDDDDEDEEEIKEGLSVQARLKKRQAFARSRGKRGVALRMKLRRASTMETLKKRAILAARRSLYKRLLRGRDKAQLSASEKSRVEQQVKRLKTFQNVLVTKMMPRIRSIEQKRLASYRAKK